MKKLFFLLLLYPAISNAQFPSIFDSNSPDVYKEVADIVIHSSGISFNFIQTDSIGDGKYSSMYISIKNDTLVLVVHDSLLGKSLMHIYSVISVKGPFDLLFPVWRAHFEGEAKEATLIAHEHGTAFALKKPGGHEKIFSFGKMEDNPNWRIRAKDW